MTKGEERVPERINAAGHVIDVRGRPGVDEELWIDGERRQFFVSSGGYHLLDDAYRPGTKTLAEAARRYVERYPRRASEA
jgi:hypothetical protein